MHQVMFRGNVRQGRQNVPGRQENQSMQAQKASYLHSCMYRWAERCDKRQGICCQCRRPGAPGQHGRARVGLPASAALLIKLQQLVQLRVQLIQPSLHVSCHLRNLHIQAVNLHADLRSLHAQAI